MLPPRAKGRHQRTPGIGTSPTQGCPSTLASGGSHGDDVGQYSTVESTKKALVGVGPVRQQRGAPLRVGASALLAGAQIHPEMRLFLLPSVPYILKPPEKYWTQPKNRGHGADSCQTGALVSGGESPPSASESA
jgi:hypothetical protein